MNKKRKAVNFEELLERMEKDKEPAEGWPTITGGECTEGGLSEWLKKLDLTEMDVRIWEFTDHCTIGTDGPPGKVERLERARLFGEEGDLEIRRDGKIERDGEQFPRFLWRYVGRKKYAPTGEKLAWPGDENSPVYCREQMVLLWGTREGNQKQWFDDRVSGASLTYFADPAPLPDKVKERVWVRFREYTQAGRTLAVWLQGLEAYEEVDNG
jgi:hypothetical protein